jgi:GNAT superfamily N-acetyltransferase
MPKTKYREIGGTECIGEVDYSIGHDGNTRHFRLNLIFLEGKCRGKGYGKTIMHDIIKKAKKLGCKKIILSVKDPEYNVFSSYDFRRKFFEKFGFRFDGHGFGELNLQQELTLKEMDFQ